LGAELETRFIMVLQLVFDRFVWLGVAGMMAFENATGLTPSEVILGLAGWMLLAAHGAPFPMIFVGGLYTALGSLSGSMLTYGLARLGGRPVVDRLAHWFRIHPQHIMRAERQFQRWGPIVVLLGRMVPGVRTLVTIPAGLVRMPLLHFVCYTFVGTYAWCTLVIGIGYALGNEWILIKSILDQFSPWFLAALAGLGILGFVVWRAITRFRSRCVLSPTVIGDSASDGPAAAGG
jgi:membrane protein DedA with SNARE-associated domain